MKGSTLAAVRKLKDTTGQYLWQPSLMVNQPDMLLGYPVYENPDMVATGTAAKSIIFGDFSSYYVRQVRGIEVARDDSVGFVSDLITFRPLQLSSTSLVLLPDHWQQPLVTL
jgi:HK97 family phage major capsid protein